MPLSYKPSGGLLRDSIGKVLIVAEHRSGDCSNPLYNLYNISFFVDDLVQDKQ